MAEGPTGTWFAQPQAQSEGLGEVVRFRLRLLRGAIRAWHTTMVVTAIIGQVLDLVLWRISGSTWFMPWAQDHRSRGEQSVLIAAAGLALLLRIVLCATAWSRGYQRIYPRIAPACVMVGHLCAMVAYSYGIFGGRQGYVVLATLLMFAASMLSGLSLRQSVAVNVASVAVLVLAAWLEGVPAAVVVPVIYAMLLCCVMCGVAAWTLESSSRGMLAEHSRVRDLAVLDGLTGLKNRHAFNTHLPEVWQIAMQERRALTLLLIDVDFFKSYNDTRGHVAGDQALRDIARAIQGVANGPTDFVARYGGDEIAVVLLDATADAVITLTTRMHEAVSALGLALHDDDHTRRVTLSTGVAHLLCPLTGTSPLAAVQVADQALYTAKRAGRNRFALLTEAADPDTASVFEPARFRHTA